MTRTSYKEEGLWAGNIKLGQNNEITIDGPGARRVEDVSAVYGWS